MNDVDYEIYEDELTWDFSYDYYNVRFHLLNFIKDGEEVEVKKRNKQHSYILTDRL